MFASLIIAGFECARLEWQNNRCLLTSTDHVPDAQMRQHYETVKALGMFTARDGLPWWLPIEPRLQVARDAGVQVIWDLNHWWRHEAPTDYAKRLVMAVDRVCPDQPFWCCFNETWLHPVMCPGQSREQVISEAVDILRMLRVNLPDVRLITAEPAHVAAEVEAHAELADEAEIIGVNFYPQYAEQTVEEILHRTAARYPGKRIMISETGLHSGYAGSWSRPDVHAPEMTKADWLRKVQAGVERSGVPIDGICIYPIVNGTDWHAGGHTRYDNGLIREDGSVDEDFAGAIRMAGQQHAEAA